jgi:adenylate kinase family enzyme
MTRWLSENCNMHRVAVLGSGGAGKTTFSRELGRRAGLPVIHLDRYYWCPYWTPTPADQWRRTMTELAAGDRWVIDGNYGGSLDIRLERADTVIILALSRWLCLVRVLRRWWMNKGRAVQSDGCPERLDWQFLRWVWRYPADSRPRIDAALAQFANKVRVVELASSAAAQSFLHDVSSQHNHRPDKT